MSIPLFSLCFLFVLILNYALKQGLSYRQARYVQAHRPEVPNAFKNSITLAEHQKAADYTIAKLRVGAWDLSIGFLVTYLLTLGGGLALLSHELAAYWPVGSVWHGVAVLSSLTVLTTLIDLPLTLYTTFVTEKRFGFNRMTPKLFVLDLLKSAFIGALIGLPLLALILWLMQAMGTYWWFWVWCVWMALNLGAMVIWPVFIAPLFNQFKPLEDEKLKSRIEALLTRCGFKSSGLFVMDGSKRSAHGNAYFTGLGSAKRIVFYDTLLEKLAPEEVEAVLAHELGHFHHKHLWKRLAFLAPMSLALLAGLGWLMTQPWFFQGLGVNTASPAIALALFSIALPLFVFPLTPLSSGWSRRHEFEADAYAVRHARAQDLKTALVKLYRDNASTLTPDPLYTRFYASHPPAAIRLARLAETPQNG